MRHVLFFCLGLIVFLLDQITKMIIVGSFKDHESKSVIPGFFDLTLVHNKGVAFGLLSDFPSSIRVILLIIIVVLAISLLFHLYFSTYRRDNLGQLAVSIIAGGAAGNIYDRLTIGAVIDFLDFYYKGWRWPAFNLADSAICIGVAILLFKPPK